ncbi:ATP-binding protein [Kitasatospora sp. NBC_01539]|uniref:ATP-binding protein n=1 Tax=Kitasatospora sp. NBC_01539 TaxID=2903577 RepID=UPI0038600942
MNSSAQTVGGPVTGRRRRLRLAGPGQARAGREFTAAALRGWGIADGGEFGSDVRLVVSELVANACRHADGATGLLLVLTDRTLRIEVADEGAGLPEHRAPHSPDRPGGHGLHLLDRLADTWGVAPATVGKTVWAEITRPASSG